MEGLEDALAVLVGGPDVTETDGLLEGAEPVVAFIDDDWFQLPQSLHSWRRSRFECGVAMKGLFDVLDRVKEFVAIGF